MHKWVMGMAVVALVALPTLPAVATAQSAVGVRAGVRSSQLEVGQSSGSIRSLVLGGYYGFGISDRLAVQIEAVHGNRGAEGIGLGNETLDSNADPVDIEMTYFEAPVLLRAGFPGELLLPSVFLGPYIGFLLDCEIRPADGGSRACDESGAAQRFHPRSTEYGMVIGAALDLFWGDSTIFLDTRYTMGLRPIQSGDEAFDARHTGVAITGGVAVPLGR